MDATFTGTTTSDQGGLASNGNKSVLYSLQISWTEASPSAAVLGQIQDKPYFFSEFCQQRNYKVKYV